MTFVEGWSFTQMLGALAENPAVEHTLADVAPEAIMQMLGATEPSPEGLFFPDTYRFARGTRDLAILEQAYAAMQARLEAAWATRTSSLPFDTPYEALILASMIEKETRIDAERGRIAGVFVRRLRIGMRLQSDPTVTMEWREFDGNLRVVDLQRHALQHLAPRGGLPATPIAMPGAGSLQAAVQPEEGDARISLRPATAVTISPRRWRASAGDRALSAQPARYTGTTLMRGRFITLEGIEARAEHTARDRAP